MRIAFIAESIYEGAGIERVLAARVNDLCKDFNVTFLTLDDGSRPDCFPLDEKVKRVYLSVHDKKSCYKVLSSYLKENPQDITVSTGGLEFYVLYHIRDGSKKIFEFHFPFSISKIWMAQRFHGILRWMAYHFQTWKRIWIARHYDKIIVLCKADEQRWKQFTDKVVCIYNPLTISTEEYSSCENKKVIAAGRLSPEKGFDDLIDSWSIVNKKHPNWILNIFGEGTEHKALLRQIDKLGLRDCVTLCGSTDDIVSEYIDSSLFVLSSREEAFGLVIIEAEACGLPIVAFDCPSGPAELVEDKHNGFLVKAKDVVQLAEKICYLIENKSLRKTFGARSVEISQRFELKKVMAKWRSLYTNLNNRI
jgi:glycosyltransferase involved in cell wall biosynthesis